MIGRARATRLLKEPLGLGVSWYGPERCRSVDLSRREACLTLPSTVVPAASPISRAPHCLPEHIFSRTQRYISTHQQDEFVRGVTAANMTTSHVRSPAWTDAWFATAWNGGIRGMGVPCPHEDELTKAGQCGLLSAPCQSCPLCSTAAQRSMPHAAALWLSVVSGLHISDQAGAAIRMKGL